ncbi:RnfH family protein [Rhodoferax sp. PAMC 29310]|uniref:RnfH family protein n=1 Tax=Rhodoferax sp. PAMC 29310 TaxID=2822760 RepID=UPI001B319FE9|nr:RnfH family protein [Rhodoferax sp. PAMC 29310]
MASELIQITLVYSPTPRVVREQIMGVPDGTTVHQALMRSVLVVEYPDLLNDETQIGIWGRLSNLTQILRDKDRIEVYRPLTVDPKVARRERFTKQGAKAAGLFAKKRLGAKAGY